MRQGERSMICVDPATTALVVVDMQNDFCSADGYYATVGRDISQLAACARPVAALLARARQARMTIVFTRLLYDEVRGSMEDRHTIRPRRWTASGKRLMPGTRGADVIDEIAPRSDEIILDKTGYSAFEGTNLEQQLRERGIKTVIMAGVVTYACVLATAFSAFDRDFDVILRPMPSAAGKRISARKPRTLSTFCSAFRCRRARSISCAAGAS